MTSTKLPGLALALVALTPAGCGGAVEGTGTGGSSTTAGQGAGGSTGGQTTTGGGGGTGGQTTTGGGSGTGGQTTTGGGGGGGCTSACVTSADCPADLPVCANVGTGCNLCLGPCNGAQCMGSNTCIFDADCNGSPDGKCVCGPSECTMCVIAITEELPGFPATLGEGVWLIGWSGGLDHYSWVRFSFLTTTTGTFTLLDPVGVTLTPFYPCEGSGPFTVNLVTGGVVLTLPAGCDTPETHLDFLSFSDPGGFPPHAVMAASILTMGQTISGFQHDAGFCDAGFTACGDPFLP